MPKTQNDTNDNMEAAKNDKNGTWGKYHHHANMTKERWGESTKDKYRTKWTIPGAKKEGELIISRSMRSTGALQEQHRATHTLARQYEPEPAAQSPEDETILQRSKEIKTPTPSDTGEELRYDIRDLRLHPEKLTTWYQEQEQEAARTRTPQRNAHQHGKQTTQHKNGSTTRTNEAHRCNKYIHSESNRRTRKNLNGLQN